MESGLQGLRIVAWPCFHPVPFFEFKCNIDKRVELINIDFGGSHETMNFTRASYGERVWVGWGKDCWDGFVRAGIREGLVEVNGDEGMGLGQDQKLSKEMEKGKGGEPLTLSL